MATKKVYQTLEDRDTDLIKLEQNGPYICRWQNSWLGNGYYFWDTFIQNAHWWGKEGRSYPNGYIICQALCDFNDNECLDLVGNMEQIKMFREAFELLKAKGQVDETTTLKKFINILQGELESFDYTAIRVNGNRSRQHYSKFNMNLLLENNKNYFVDFNPPVQICFYSKTSLNLRNYKIVYPEKYVDDIV